MWLRRLLARADVRNQATLDAIADRVHITGPGIVFVSSPHFTDGEWSAFPPRVCVDGGPPHRLPFGTSFVEMAPGQRRLRFESGAPVPWRHAGIDTIVDVPVDGTVTLSVECQFIHIAAPVVSPGEGADDALWLKVTETFPSSPTRIEYGIPRRNRLWNRALLWFSSVLVVVWTVGVIVAGLWWWAPMAVGMWTVMTLMVRRNERVALVADGDTLLVTNFFGSRRVQRSEITVIRVIETGRWVPRANLEIRLSDGTSIWPDVMASGRERRVPDDIWECRRRLREWVQAP